MVRTKQSARKAKAGGIFSAFGNLDRRSEGEEVGPSYEDTYDTLQEVRLEKLYNLHVVPLVILLLFCFAVVIH